jgi:hypothetical protein
MVKKQGKIGFIAIPRPPGKSTIYVQKMWETQGKSPLTHGD